jgi:hypothetical protein
VPFAAGLLVKRLYPARPMLEPLTNSQIRKFKAAAQLMDATLKVGKAGTGTNWSK